MCKGGDVVVSASLRVETSAAALTLVRVHLCARVGVLGGPLTLCQVDNDVLASVVLFAAVDHPCPVDRVADIKLVNRKFFELCASEAPYDLLNRFFGFYGSYGRVGMLPIHYQATAKSWFQRCTDDTTKSFITSDCERLYKPIQKGLDYHSVKGYLQMMNFRLLAETFTEIERAWWFMEQEEGLGGIDFFGGMFNFSMLMLGTWNDWHDCDEYVQLVTHERTRDAKESWGTIMQSAVGTTAKINALWSVLESVRGSPPTIVCDIVRCSCRLIDILDTQPIDTVETVHRKEIEDMFEVITSMRTDKSIHGDWILGHGTVHEGGRIPPMTWLIRDLLLHWAQLPLLREKYIFTEGKLCLPYRGMETCDGYFRLRLPHDKDRLIDTNNGLYPPSDEDEY